MSHHIDGYAGVLPAWHKLGVVISDAEAKDSKTMAMRAGLNWHVVLEPVVNAAGNELEDKKIVTRLDRMTPLGVVGNQYVPVQNADMFGFMDNVLSASGAFYETAGSLWDGRKVWALARLPESFDVVKGDSINRYLLFSGAHDGSSSVKVAPTSIRVVCANTLAMALREIAGNKQSWNVRHSGDVFAKLMDVTDKVRALDSAFKQTQEAYQALAKREVTQAEVDEVCKRLIPDTKDNTANLQRARIQELFDAGMGSDIPGVRGTLWGLYNAVTEFEDHKRGENSKSQDADSVRLNSLWFGSGMMRKQSALEELLVLAR